MSKRSIKSGYTVARHSRLKPVNSVRQLFALFGVAVAVVVVSVVGVFGYTAWSFASDFVGNAENIYGQDGAPLDIGDFKGGANILITGTDECLPSFAKEFPGRCSDSSVDGSINNDVNIVAHISDNPRRVTVISFPRDLMIPIPQCEQKDGSFSSAARKLQLNTTYYTGGLNCVAKTISQLSGLDIRYAAKITWGGVIQITDVLGGVDVCVENRIYDPQNTGLDLSAGEHTLVGLQALQFLRVRHGIGDGSDLGRISNQQVYLSSLARKMLSSGVLSDPATLLRLASTAVKNITPSNTLTNPTTIAQIAAAIKSVPFDDVVFVQYPVYTDPDNPNRVVPNKTAAEKLWAALDANEPLTLTGKVSSNDGSVLATPSPSPSSSASTPSATSSARTGSTPTPTATSAPSVGELPSDITGQTAAQQTCSNGSRH